MKIRRSAGFTLLEILLVVAAIAILAGIIIVAINPAQQLAETRDAQRHSDVQALSNAITQYVIKNPTGTLLNQLASGDGTCAQTVDDNDVRICKEDESCGGAEIDDYLVPDYIAALPIDPVAEDSDEDTGYVAYQLSNGRIYVCAPYAEEADSGISITR